MSSRARAYLYTMLACLCLAIAFILVFKRSPRFSPQDAAQRRTSQHESSRESGPSTAADNRRSPKGDRHNRSPVSELTPHDDPEILAITEQIKVLEHKRTTFCRETETEDKVIETFLLKYPSPAEEEHIKRLISKARGLTLDDNRDIVTWQERLTREHLWPSQFEYCIITTEYFKKSGKGDYTVLGVPTGQLMMRDGNSPMSADGSIYVLSSALSFSYDSPWRFSHLFEVEEERDESAGS